MSDAPNLFRLLSDEWDRQGSGSPARAALARWAKDHPDLECFRDPGQLVEHCRVQRGSAAHHGEVQGLLRAVMSFAGTDGWAARTVLQALLPGLARVARRASGYVGGTAAVWQGIDDVDQQVVATACERIAALAADPPPEVATAVVDGTWQRVRAHALAELRHRARRAPEGEHALGTMAFSAPSRTPAEELAAALVEAVESGVLQRLDAGVVYASRIRGRQIEEIAPLLGRHPHWVWRRRERVEALLLAEAAGRPFGRLAARLAG